MINKKKICENESREKETIENKYETNKEEHENCNKKYDELFYFQ